MAAGFLNGPRGVAGPSQPVNGALVIGVNRSLGKVETSCEYMRDRRPMILRLAVVAAALGCIMASDQSLAQSEDARTLETPCAQGQLMACANLGVLNKHGRSTPRNYPRALTLFVRACEGGVDFACGNVGEMTFLGLGVASSQPDGAAILKGACRRGDAWSCETARRLGVKTTKKSPA